MSDNQYPGDAEPGSSSGRLAETKLENCGGEGVRQELFYFNGLNTNYDIVPYIVPVECGGMHRTIANEVHIRHDPAHWVPARFKVYKILFTYSRRFRKPVARVRGYLSGNYRFSPILPRQELISLISPPASAPRTKRPRGPIGPLLSGRHWARWWDAGRVCAPRNVRPAHQRPMPRQAFAV